MVTGWSKIAVASWARSVSDYSADCAAYGLQTKSFVSHVVLGLFALAGHAGRPLPPSVPLSVPASTLASAPASTVSQGSHAILLFGAQKQY